jgi:peroxiredoxin
VFTISSAGELCTFNDDYEETSDVGTTLSAITSDGDSTAGNDTIRVKYVTTSDSSTNVTMEYQVQILV